MAKGNPFLDKQFEPDMPTAKQGARRLVSLYNQYIETSINLLTETNRIVSTHTRDALKEQLGEQSSVQLLAVFNSVKALVENAAPNIQVSDLEA